MVIIAHKLNEKYFSSACGIFRQSDRTKHDTMSHHQWDSFLAALLLPKTAQLLKN